MRKMKKFLALSLSVSMLAASLVACTSKEAETESGTNAATEAASTEAAGTEATTEGTEEGLNIAVSIGSEPSTIDPTLNTSSDGGMMIEHMFEGLLKRVNDGQGGAELVLGQAASYEVNEEETVYTFTLRDDAMWSDGQKVVAGDFVYTWQRLVDPETASDYNKIIQMVKNAKAITEGEMDVTELGIVALDESTLEITLESPTSYFLQICAFATTYPVRQDIIEEHGDQWSRKAETYVSNGMYTLESWTHNSAIKVVASEYYYDQDIVGPDSIEFVLMDDQNAMLAAFRSGELDFIKDMPADEIPTLIENGEIKLWDMLGTYYISFNNEVAPFDNPLVREAFSLAIDRDYLINEVLRGGQAPAAGFVPSGIYDAAGLAGDDFRTVGGDYIDLNDMEANEERARELLAEAGYPNGEGFPTVEYIYNTNDSHRVIGEMFQGMLKDVLNVDITLSNQDWSVFLVERKEGNYVIARNGWIADYNDPTSFLDLAYSTNGNNDGNYSNPAYDALMDEAKVTLDVEKRMEILHKAEDLLMSEAGVAPVYFYTDKSMFNDALDGLYHSVEGHYYFGEIKLK